MYFTASVVFALGVLTGIVIVFIVLFIYSAEQLKNRKVRNDDYDLNIYEEDMSDGNQERQ